VRQAQGPAGGADHIVSPEPNLTDYALGAVDDVVLHADDPTIIGLGAAAGDMGVCSDSWSSRDQ